MKNFLKNNFKVILMIVGFIVVIYAGIQYVEQSLRATEVIIN